MTFLALFVSSLFAQNLQVQDFVKPLIFNFISQATFIEHHQMHTTPYSDWGRRVDHDLYYAAKAEKRINVPYLVFKSDLNRQDGLEKYLSLVSTVTATKNNLLMGKTPVRITFYEDLHHHGVIEWQQNSDDPNMSDLHGAMVLQPKNHYMLGVAIAINVYSKHPWFLQRVTRPKLVETQAESFIEAIEALNQTP